MSMKGREEGDIQYASLTEVTPHRVCIVLSNTHVYVCVCMYVFLS